MKNYVENTVLCKYLASHLWLSALEKKISLYLCPKI